MREREERKRRERERERRERRERRESEKRGRERERRERFVQIYNVSLCILMQKRIHSYMCVCVSEFVFVCKYHLHELLCYLLI
jgi:hypothetical protein